MSPTSVVERESRHNSTHLGRHFAKTPGCFPTMSVAVVVKIHVFELEGNHPAFHNRQVAPLMYNSLPEPQIPKP